MGSNSKFSLKDIGTYTMAIESIASAVGELDPPLAVEALRFVLRAVEPDDVLPEPHGGGQPIETRLVPYELRDRAATERLSEKIAQPRATPATPAQPIEVRDQVADKLVAEGWDHPSAMRAAKRAIKMRGKSSGLVTLVAQAKALAENSKRFKPKRHEPKGPKSGSPLIDDAVDFVERHPGCKSGEYAAKCGIGVGGAGGRLQKAREAGRIRMEGVRGSARWFPVEKAEKAA